MIGYCSNSLFVSPAWQDDPEQDDLPDEDEQAIPDLCRVCGRGDALTEDDLCYDCMTTSEAALAVVS